MEVQDSGGETGQELAARVTAKDWSGAAEVLVGVAEHDAAAAWSLLVGHAILVDEGTEVEKNADVLAQVLSAVNTSSSTIADVLAIEMLHDVGVFGTATAKGAVVPRMMEALWKINASLAQRWQLVVAQDLTHVHPEQVDDAQVRRAQVHKLPQAYRTHIHTLAIQAPALAATELWATLGDGHETYMAELLAGMSAPHIARVLLAAADQGRDVDVGDILAVMNPTPAREILTNMATTDPKTTATVLGFMSYNHTEQAATLLADMAPQDTGDILAVTAQQGYSSGVYDILAAMDPAAAMEIHKTHPRLAQ